MKTDMHVLRPGSLLLVVLLLLAVGGCVSEPDYEVVVADPSANSFREIQTDSDFNWETSQKVTLQVEGLPVPNDIQKTLKVSSTNGNAVYFMKLQQLSQSLNVQIVIPASVNRVRIEYGTIIKYVEVVNSVLRFSYVPEQPEV